MSQLFALSVDCLASPSISLYPNPRATHHEKLYGWGFAWYPGDEYSSMVVKDATSPVNNSLTSVLQDWKRFRSTVFICHLRGAAKRISQPNTHPFSRSFAGRDWIWAHNGDIEVKNFKTKYPRLDAPFEPIGKTDSELIFCILLNQFHQKKLRRIFDIKAEELLSFFQIVDSFGTANFVFSDGQTLAIYNDLDNSNPLYWKRCCPPHKSLVHEFNTVHLAFNEALDVNRTMIIFSSGKPEDEGWSIMKAGQLLLVRKGAIVWDSHVSLGETEDRAKGCVAGDAVGKTSLSHTGGQMETALQGQKQNNRSAHTSVDERVLSVVHETTYTYEKAVEYSTHIFRLQPMHDTTQELLEHDLEISCEGEKSYYTDVFGNASIHMIIDKPYTELKISSRSLVKILVLPPDDFSNQIRRASIPLVWMPWQRQMMWPYLLPPELPEPQLRELSDFAMSFVERNDYDLFETLCDINRCFYSDFSYVTGATSLETTPFQVYSKRQGVCQDFANLMICLARLLNIPARYHVGYIYTGGNYENKIQSDASHAWVEVYLPYIGWRAFDPTNGCLVKRDHIRVACGRNYRDATPTSGTIFKGGGNEKLEVSVRVNEATAENSANPE